MTPLIWIQTLGSSLLLLRLVMVSGSGTLIVQLSAVNQFQLSCLLALTLLLFLLLPCVPHVMPN
jgi:hypothetical protein